MKLTMEITGVESGQAHSKKKGELVDWTRVTGTDRNGRFAKALLFGPPAIALGQKLSGLLSRGEDIGSKRLSVTFDGAWKTDEKTGKRNFWASTFDILDGIALEAERLRKDARDSLKTAEAFRANGDMPHAYEALARFVANYAGVPLDLEGLDAAESDDAIFGPIASESDPDPEDLAAAEYARQDGRAAGAVESEQTAPPAEVSSEAPADFDSGMDAELSGEPVGDDVPVQHGLNDAVASASPDVLDDEPSADAPREKEARPFVKPSMDADQAKSAPAPKPGRAAPTAAFASPFGKRPFG